MIVLLSVFVLLLGVLGMFFLWYYSTRDTIDEIALATLSAAASAVDEATAGMVVSKCLKQALALIAIPTPFPYSSPSYRCCRPWRLELSLRPVL